MKTYRERIDECRQYFETADDYYIPQSDVSGMLDEIEHRINDIKDLIQSYEVKQAYNDLEQLAKELY